MERNIIEFTDRLSAAGTAAWTTTVDFFNARGFEHGGFARVSECSPVLDDFVTTLPLDYWRDWCRTRSDLTDPGICHARQSTQPVFHHFGKVAADARPPPGVCDLRDYLPGYTATSLFATPEPRSAEDEAEGRVGVMAWGAAMDRAAFGAAQRRDGAVLVLAAHLAMAKMARMAGGVAIDTAGKTVFHDARPPRAGEAPNGARLSPRESECLLWLARGLRNDRIAERLAVSPATVEMHLARAASAPRPRTARLGRSGGDHVALRGVHSVPASAQGRTTQFDANAKMSGGTGEAHLRRADSMTSSSRRKFSSNGSQSVHSAV